MSDSLSTSQGSLSLGKNYSCSVAVTSCGVSTGRAHEDSFGQFESLLGSRETTRTRHCCVGGRHYHHTSARPRGVGKKFTFGLSGSVVRCFTGHRGLEQKLGTEVFDREHGRLKIVVGIGPRGDGGHTPVDTDRTVSLRPGLFVALDNEAGVPVPERITVNPNRGRFTGQVAVPDNRQRRALHIQPPGLYSEPADCEPVTGIPDRGQVTFGFEGPFPFAAKRVQGLLLHVLRPSPQPVQTFPCRGQIFPADQPAVSVVTRTDHLVPQPTRPVPLRFEHSNSGCARAQPVVVTQRLSHRHTPKLGEGSDIRREHHMDTATSRRPHLPMAKARGISGGFR